MNFIEKFKKQLRKGSTSEPTKNYSFGSVDYTIDNIPCIIEKRNDPWVIYGENNLYPLQVSDLRNGSAIHNSIVKTKAKMTAGDGFLINGAISEEESKVKYDSLPSAVKTEYDLFLTNPHNSEDLTQVTEKLADELQEQGQYCYEVIFNNDFSKIVRTKYVKTEYIRSGKMVGDKVQSYWYSRDWTKTKQSEFKPVEIPVFDGVNKTSLNQLVFEKIGKQDYYGELPYKGALNWIMIDFKMSIFHLSNLDNGMNPSMWFKYYKLPETEEQKQEIINNHKKAFKGVSNAGKFQISFSNGKELAPDIMPIANSNLDKQLLNLTEICDKKILTGHQLTSPLLAGVAVSGQLGGNTELETAYKILDNMSIEADRKHIERSLQKVLDYNKTPIQLAINPFNPFKEKAIVKASGGVTEAINTLSPLVANKVLESMTADEIRNLIGLAPAKVTIQPTV
jgi:hypothetical protein